MDCLPRHAIVMSASASHETVHSGASDSDLPLKDEGTAKEEENLKSTSPVCSPPAKRLKQARLPFKVLDFSPAESQKQSSDCSAKHLFPAGRERKCVSNAQKRTEDKTDASFEKLGVIKADDSEISSSSEAEPVLKPEKKKKPSLLDMFVRTTQEPKVSTSHPDDAADAAHLIAEQAAVDVIVGDDEKPSAPEHSHCVQLVKPNCCGNEFAPNAGLENRPPVSDDAEAAAKSLQTVKEPQSNHPEKEVIGVDKLPGTSTESLPIEPETPKLKSGTRRREQARQEKVARLAEEKAEKERMKAEKLAAKEEERKKKEEERQKKEEEKKEKKEREEKERLEKQRLREEEAVRKKAIQDAKLEEKLKKEEEKRLMEEEAERKREKAKEMFKSFFVATTKAAPVPKPKNEGHFMAYEVKENQRLAPALRRKKVDAENLDKVVCCQEFVGPFWVEEIKSSSYKIGKSTKTWPKEDDIQVLDETSKRLRAKLLQFEENNRPAYYGTYRKKSKIITGKNPVAKDEKLFDYEVDSDEEWEEEEPGENISHSEGEENESDGDVEADDDDDKFFVPHGYLSDGEGVDDDEVSPDAKKAKLKVMESAWQAELKRKCTKMKSVTFGCVWADQLTDVSDVTVQYLQKYQAVGIVATPILTSYTDTDPLSSSNTNKQDDVYNKKLKPVPKEAMVDLITLVHGNISGVKKLIREFREYWRLKTNPSVDGNGKQGETNENEAETSTTPNSNEDDKKEYAISKRQLEKVISNIAVREKRAGYHRICWYVNDGTLAEYGLDQLKPPNHWKYVSCANVNTEKTPRTVTPKRKLSIEKFATLMSPEEIHTAAQKEVTATPKARKAKKSSIERFTHKMSPAEVHKPTAGDVRVLPNSHQGQVSDANTSLSSVGILQFVTKAATDQHKQPVCESKHTMVLSKNETEINGSQQPIDLSRPTIIEGVSDAATEKMLVSNKPIESVGPGSDAVDCIILD